MDITLNTGETIKLPGLPLEFNGHKAQLRQSPPQPGQGGKQHLHTLGLSDERIRALVEAGVLIAD
jgi:crotonobetainyl-CoA:carnitine CoA-transferase CaiB-like acyl-CoA transferase